MIQHRHHQAVALLKKAADLDSSEACLNLAILFSQGLDEGHPEEKIDSNPELAARFAIQGLSLEHAKASPFPPQASSTSAHPAAPDGLPSQSTSQHLDPHAEAVNGSANGNHKILAGQPDQDNTLNLEVTAHLANALTGLFRRGSITQDMSLRASAKGKSEDVWESGTKVAYLLLDHPAVMRSPLQASAAAAADELWLPSSTARTTSSGGSASRRSSSRPGLQPFTLTSNQQLRRSIYVSLCYLLALVAYDLAVRHKTADFSDALMWWRRCINIERQPGGSGTKDAEALIAKARFRVDMIEKAQRRDAQSRKGVHPQSSSMSTSTPPLARASSSQVVLKHSPDKSLSLSAALDRSRSGDKHPDMYMPSFNRRHTAAAKVNGVLASSQTSAVPSSLPLHQSNLNRLPTSVPASKPYSPSQSPTQEVPGFEPRQASASAGMPPSPSQKLRALHIKPFRSKAKSSLRFLAPHAAASRCGPTSATCYLSDEMVGVPASSLRHRASSASLFSDAAAELEDSIGPSTSSTAGRKRTMSSASVASLPHFSATAPFEARSRPRASSVLNPFGRSVNRHSVISNTSDDSAAAPAQDQQQQPSQEAGQPKPSEATGALMAVLRSDLLAEQDYDDWMAEQEAENYSSEPEDEDEAAAEVDIRPAQSTSKPATTKPKSPSFHVTSPSTEAVPEPPLPKEEPPAPQPNGRHKPRMSRLTTTTVDPVLDALEKASKFNRVSRCMVCGVKGINFRKLALFNQDTWLLVELFGADLTDIVQLHAQSASRCIAAVAAEWPKRAAVMDALAPRPRHRNGCKEAETVSLSQATVTRQYMYTSIYFIFFARPVIRRFFISLNLEY